MHKNQKLDVSDILSKKVNSPKSLSANNLTSNTTSGSATSNGNYVLNNITSGSTSGYVIGTATPATVQYQYIGSQYTPELVDPNRVKELEDEIKFLKGAIILLMDDIGYMRRKIEEITENSVY